MDESGTDGAECSKKVASGRRVAGAIRSLVNTRDLQLEYARVLHETLLVSFLCMAVRLLWKERSRIRAILMDNLRGLLGIRVLNARIRDLCGVTKVCSGGSAMWRGWRLIRLLRESM